MYVEWTKHLATDEEKANFRKTILSAKPVLNRIKDILAEKEKALDRSEMSIETYNTPNWSERQAHKNGNRESIDFLKKLVDLDQQKIPTKE
jgi:hypothetical protein